MNNFRVTASKLWILPFCVQTDMRLSLLYGSYAGGHSSDGGKSFGTVIQLGIRNRKLWFLYSAPTWRSLTSCFDLVLLWVPSFTLKVILNTRIANDRECNYLDITPADPSPAVERTTMNKPSLPDSGTPLLNLPAHASFLISFSISPTREAFCDLWEKCMRKQV